MMYCSRTVSGPSPEGLLSPNRPCKLPPKAFLSKLQVALQFFFWQTPLHVSKPNVLAISETPTLLSSTVQGFLQWEVPHPLS